jgi:arabinose-5-phosphate isomerase
MMSSKGIGMTCVVDRGGKLLWIFTDGDLRRTLEKHDNIRGVRVGDVMTRQPKTIAADRLAAEAAQMMQAGRVGGRIVVTTPDNTLQGVVTFNDLLAAGVV